MAADPTKSLAPKSMSSAGKNGLSPLSPADLADLSLRELLGMLLSSVGFAERKAYLQRLLQDKPNGFYDRSLQLGTIPLDVRVPRTPEWGVPPRQPASAVSARLQRRNPGPVVGPSEFGPISACRQRCPAEDGTF